MFMLRLMQAFSCLLWFCMVFGVYSGIRDLVYLPLLVGIPINLAWQFGTRVAIRERKQRLINATEG
jgi:hypothetical protein